MKNTSLKESAKNAWQGLKTAFRDEKNFRIEVIIGILVIIASLVFKITILEFTAVIFCVILVLVAELINSALEHLVDLFSPEYHELARKAKDISAGAVLVISFGSVIIGLLIFTPRIMNLL